jgi:pimeloyl-ACP methyl ester carboxylesterase
MTDERRLTVPTADGRVLDVWTSGPAGAPAVVFHMGSVAGLAPVGRHLFPRQRAIRMITYARPGYSGSTPYPGRAASEAATDTIAVLDALGVDEFVTLGWSGGAPHALACSALLPERCRATAVIAGVAPYLGDHEVRSWYDELPEITPLLRGDDTAFTAMLVEQAHQLEQTRPEDVPDLFPSVADKASATGAHAEWLASIFRTAYDAGPAGVHDDWVAFVTEWGYDVGASRHVSVWHGEQDRIPLSHPRWIAEHSPGATLNIFSDEGHCSLLLKLPAIIDGLLELADMRQATSAR